MENKNNNFRILSIDGGGIKGLFAASFFATIEKRLNKNIADYFDLIVGTSTGGIIALALANRLIAKDIVNFYKNEGPKIFKKRNKSMAAKLLGIIFQRDCGGVIEPIYHIEPLKKALFSVFGERTLKEMYEEHKTAVCIPATNPQHCNPYVYKTPHHPKLRRHLNVKLWEAALSTSAAPIYFPIVSQESDYFVDGGLWANNPALVALTEAVGPYFNIKLENISILSVGNIRSHSSLHDFNNLEKGLLSWREKIVSITLDVQTSNVKYAMEHILGRTENKYYRVEDTIGDYNNLEKLSKLDNATDENLKLLISRGQQVASEFAVQNSFDYFFEDDGNNG